VHFRYFFEVFFLVVLFFLGFPSGKVNNKYYYRMTNSSRSVGKPAKNMGHFPGAGYGIIEGEGKGKTVVSGKRGLDFPRRGLWLQSASAKKILNRKLKETSKEKSDAKAK